MKVCLQAFANLNEGSQCEYHIEWPGGQGKLVLNFGTVTGDSGVTIYGNVSNGVSATNYDVFPSSYSTVISTSGTYDFTACPGSLYILASANGTGSCISSMELTILPAFPVE